jgi:signal transduction histidine kinase
MILRIDDDGAGFDRKGEQRGNGLVSMEARAQKIGGEITLSNLASGTRVELIISNI